MSEVENSTHDQGLKEGHLVSVIVDGVEKKIQAKSYELAAFKSAVGIPADKVVDEVVNGQFVELSDGQPVKIKGGEKFVSHGKGGGSS